jgi:acetoin utilization protein AcuB
MATKVVTVVGDDDVFTAKEKMAAHRIRHLPVVVGADRLIGIVTDRDIRSALPHRYFKEDVPKEEVDAYRHVKVKDIMTTEVVTVKVSDTIPDALLLIQQKRVGAFPVVDEDGRLKGIISVRDLLRAFINVLGIGQPGVLLCIVVEEKVGQLKKIVDAITGMNVSFGSIMVARFWDKDKRALFPYLLTQNVAPVKKRLLELGYTLLDPLQWYMDQLPENDRS